MAARSGACATCAPASPAGLPNRVLMREYLTPAIARARDDDRQLVLLHAGLA